MKMTHSVVTHSVRCVALIFSLIFIFIPALHSQTVTSYDLPPQNSTPLHIIATGDVNSNGSGEILVLHAADDLRGQYAAYYELTPSGAKQLWDFHLPQSLNGDITGILYGDLDSNGRPEILCIANTVVARSQASHTPWLFAFEWNGATFAEGATSRWSYQATNGINLRPTDFTASDFDGDGRTELAVIFGSPERIGLIIQRDGTVQSGVWTPEFQFSLPNDSNSAYRYYIRKADLTADNIEELLLFSTRQDIAALVYTYVDANRYAPATSLQFPFTAGAHIVDPQIEFMDMNGDGYSDIFIGSQSGELHYLTRPDPETEIFRFQSILLRSFKTPITNLIPGKLDDHSPVLFFTLGDSSAVYQATFSFKAHSVKPDITNLEHFKDPAFFGYQFSAATVTKDQAGLLYGVHGPEARPKIIEIDWPNLSPDSQQTENMTNSGLREEIKTPSESEANRTPDKIAYIGKQFLYPVDFEILSLANLSIDFARAPQGMRYNHRESRLEWTPDLAQKGFHEVEINIRSADYHHTEEFTVLAKVDPPKIVSDPSTVITAGEPWEYQVSVADQDIYDNLEYSLLEAPENMTVNSQGWVYWLPGLNQVDDQSVTIAVSDGYDIDTQTFSVYVNAPPSFLSRPDTFVTVSQKYSYNILVGDRNQDARLQVSLDQGPKDMRLKGRQLAWTPVPNQVDHFPVRLTLSDGFLTTTQQWTIFVNAPPKITSTPIAFLAYGQQYRYQIDVYDPNAKPHIKYTLQQGPAGMSIDENGLLTWTPESNTINQQSFKIKISDGYTDDTQDGAVFINVPPKFVSEPEIVAVSELQYQYELHGEDANGDPIHFSAIRLPKFAKFDSSKNVITWKPALDQVGKQTFRLQVMDSHGATSVQEFDVQVYENPGTKPLIFSGYYVLIAVLGGIFVMAAAL